ncbi:hypothetical protein GCM10007170_31130 [Arthrobacter liuii]|uniref:Uncharacterized protein n=1 Tax=Arthrobacter liuii TaxID=1476996 RepID=A0ABQ2AWY8_9MICC|nr:hypothetical protein GCM10007170_31130 [Arthrobacter liuii]
MVADQQHSHGFFDQQFSAAPRNEDPGPNQNMPACELCPAQDVLKGDAFHPAPDIPDKFRVT